jgi:hypothetical protein
VYRYVYASVQVFSGIVPSQLDIIVEPCIGNPILSVCNGFGQTKCSQDVTAPSVRLHHCAFACVCVYACVRSPPDNMHARTHTHTHTHDALSKPHAVRCVSMLVCMYACVRLRAIIKRKGCFRGCTAPRRARSYDLDHSAVGPGCHNEARIDIFYQGRVHSC